MKVKKILAVLLSVVMIVGLMPISIFAADSAPTDPYAEYTVVTITEPNQLNDAITSASAKTKIELADGEYTMPTNLHSTNNPKDIVFVGSENAVISISQIVYATDLSFTFDGVTVKFPNTLNYIGFAHISNLIYKNCTITGQQTLYSPEVVFENCTLENMDAYCIWTWGSSAITFTNCKFNTGGKAVLVYNGSTTGNFSATVILTNCEFYGNGTVTNKAAVETGSDGGNTETSNKYNITFTNCVASGFSENNSTSPLLGNKNNMDHKHLIGIIDGVEVTSPNLPILEAAAAMISEIDSLYHLTSEKKAALKAEIDAAVEEAIENINAATTQEAITAAQNNGIAAINAVFADAVKENTKSMSFTSWIILHLLLVKERTLTFDVNGGTEITPVIGNSKTTVDLVEYAPTREGYVFNGWYSDEELTEAITSVRLRKDTTVYAGWTAIEE